MQCEAVSGQHFARLLEERASTHPRIKGSHHVYIKLGVPERISLPIHGNKPLKIGLQRHFMKLAGIMEDDLIEKADESRTKGSSQG